VRTPMNSGPQKRCASETRRTGRFACHEPVIDEGSVRGGLKQLPVRPVCCQNEPATEPPGEQADELALSRNHGPAAGRLHRGWGSPYPATDGWHELGNGAMKRLTIRRHAERQDPVKRVAERPLVEDRTQTQVEGPPPWSIDARSRSSERIPGRSEATPTAKSPLAGRRHPAHRCREVLWRAPSDSLDW
jgi:hypothetical protein